MTDIGTPLILFVSGLITLTPQLTLGRYQRPIAGLMMVVSLIMCGLVVVQLVRGEKMLLPAPVPFSVSMLLVVAGLLLHGYTYIRADARRLREKKAARQ
jgi:uncharacterized membrane protein